MEKFGWKMLSRTSNLWDGKFGVENAISNLEFGGRKFGVENAISNLEFGGGWKIWGGKSISNLEYGGVENLGWKMLYRI